eukprot:798334-Rhodomonas_salina.1
MPPKSKMSNTVAKLYGVSVSTIQQIWNRKCWAKVTEPYYEKCETLKNMSRSEDETSSSDADCEGATRRADTDIQVACGQDSDACDWATGAFESDGYSLLHDKK